MRIGRYKGLVSVKPNPRVILFLLPRSKPAVAAFADARPGPVTGPMASDLNPLSLSFSVLLVFPASHVAAAAALGRIAREGGGGAALGPLASARARLGTSALPSSGPVAAPEPVRKR